MAFNNSEFRNDLQEGLLKFILECIRNVINNFVYVPGAKETLTSQNLVEKINRQTTANSNDDFWIGCGKEHVNDTREGQEDIYFYLPDDAHTCIFFVEAKRLPKPGTKETEEYVSGRHRNDSPSGGIERYKEKIHGKDGNLRKHGMFAYIDQHDIDFWLKKVNEKITQEYDITEILKPYLHYKNEFESKHRYSRSCDFFSMHHFWLVSGYKPE